MAFARIVNQWNSQTTASAPAMTGTAGALIAVLDFCLVTTLGWTKPYSGTNTAVYKQAGGSGAYLWVDDTNANNARVRGWEIASGVGTGLGPFPTDGQQSGGDYFYKSVTADATNRAWFFVGNSKTFHLVCGSNIAATAVVLGATSAIPAGISFGEITPMVYGGAVPFSVALIAAATASATASNCAWSMTGSVGWAALAGVYTCRNYAGFGGSVASGALPDLNRVGGVSIQMGSSGSPYPNLLDGGLVLSRRFITDPSQGHWAYLPGIWSPCHAGGFANGDTFTGATGTPLAGRTFEAVQSGGTGSAGGQVFFEVSDTWD